MLSHQLKQHVIDGEKTIIQNPTDQQKKDHEKAEFEVHEVYAVDVLVSSGEGKVRVYQSYQRGLTDGVFQQHQYKCDLTYSFRPRMQDREPPFTNEILLNNTA